MDKAESVKRGERLAAEKSTLQTLDQPRAGGGQFSQIGSYNHHLAQPNLRPASPRYASSV